MITTRAFVIRTSDDPDVDHGSGPIVYEGQSLEEAHNYVMRHQQDLKPDERFDIYYRYEEEDIIQDGQKDPPVLRYNHNHDEVVLGHAYLENRPEGVFFHISFNDSDEAKRAKNFLLQNV